MSDWKTALENCSVKASLYAYAEAIEAKDQPQVEGIPGEITEIHVKKEGEGKYSMLLTVLMDGVPEEGVSEEEINHRLKVLGADPNADWE